MEKSVKGKKQPVKLYCQMLLSYNMGYDADLKTRIYLWWCECVITNLGRCLESRDALRMSTCSLDPVNQLSK